MAGKKEKLTFETCRDCGNPAINYVEIQTNRKGKIVICCKCWKTYQTKGEVASARNS